MADNASGVNSDGLVHWTQLIGVPAGFADGSDDGSGGGSGTVTSFSAGDLSPLFTTSEATATTTPALTFALTNAAQNAVFAGPASGGTGAPSYRALVAADIPSLSSVYQPADADLDTWATKTAPSGTVVGTTDSQTLTNKAFNGTLGATTPAAAAVTTLTSTGQVTQTGSTVLVPTAVTSSTIDRATSNNTESLTGNVTAALTGSHTAGKLYGITYTTDGTPRVVTLPAGIKAFGASSDTLSITIPASTKFFVGFYDDGTNDWLVSFPPVTRGTGAGYALIDGTLMVASGKTATINNTLTLAGTDSTTHTFPSTTSTLARTDAAQTFTGTQTFGAGVFTTVNGNTISTGTGTLTLGASKTLTVSETTTLNRQSSTGLPVEFYVACSDLTTDLTTGTSKAYFDAAYAFTITEVSASLLTAQSAGSIFTVDVNEAGTTILSTKLTLDNSETTSTTAATPAVISDTGIAANARITVDIDQVGTAGAKGLIVLIKGYR